MNTQHTPEPLIKTIDGNAYVKYGDYHALQQQHAELLAAAKITLRENLDLADGDCCTLYDLRTSVESVAPEWDMYGDCEAIAKAGG